MKEGDWVTLDGGEGVVYSGQMPLVTPELPQAYATVMKWGDEVRRLGVRTNADTPQDARKAREMGAEGIGLCRTEHMFFTDFEHPEKSHERQLAIQEMILAETREARVKALDKLLPFQRRDFMGIFKAMDGFPVTIRLIDPPLHEFVPHDAGQAGRAGQGSWASARTWWRGVWNNCTKRTRCWGIAVAGCAITYPEILEMQVRAIIEAAIECKKAESKYYLRSCIRSRWTGKRLQILEQATRRVADDLIKKAGVKLAVSGGHDDRVAARGVAGRTRSPKWRNSSPSAPMT